MADFEHNEPGPIDPVQSQLLAGLKAGATDPSKYANKTDAEKDIIYGALVDEVFRVAGVSPAENTTARKYCIDKCKSTKVLRSFQWTVWNGQADIKKKLKAIHEQSLADKKEYVLPAPSLVVAYIMKNIRFVEGRQEDEASKLLEAHHMFAKLKPSIERFSPTNKGALALRGVPVHLRYHKDQTTGETTNDSPDASEASDASDSSSDSDPEEGEEEGMIKFSPNKSQFARLMSRSSASWSDLNNGDRFDNLEEQTKHRIDRQTVISWTRPLMEELRKLIVDQTVVTVEINRLNVKCRNWLVVLPPEDRVAIAHAVKGFDDHLYENIVKLGDTNQTVYEWTTSVVNDLSIMAKDEPLFDLASQLHHAADFLHANDKVRSADVVDFLRRSASVQYCSAQWAKERLAHKDEIIRHQKKTIKKQWQTIQNLAKAQPRSDDNGPRGTKRKYIDDAAADETYTEKFHRAIDDLLGSDPKMGQTEKMSKPTPDFPRNNSPSTKGLLSTAEGHIHRPLGHTLRGKRPGDEQ